MFKMLPNEVIDSWLSLFRIIINELHIFDKICPSGKLNQRLLAAHSKAWNSIVRPLNFTFVGKSSCRET